MVKPFISAETYSPGNVIVLPFWVKQALKHNQMTYDDILDFKKASKILSQDDLATIAACGLMPELKLSFQDIDSSIGWYYNYSLLPKSDDRILWDEVILPMTMNNIQKAVDSLTPNNVPSLIYTDKPYEAVYSSTGKIVFIIMSAGFAVHIQQPVNKVIFSTFIYDVLSKLIPDQQLYKSYPLFCENYVRYA